EPTDQPAPPPAARVPEEDSELGRRGAREHVCDREPFDEALLRHPPAPLLQLGLHDAHDRGSAVGCGAELEERARDLSPVRRACRPTRSDHMYLRGTTTQPDCRSITSPVSP